jgi:steroid 5-alpha reductase family enzyme
MQDKTVIVCIRPFLANVGMVMTVLVLILYLSFGLFLAMTLGWWLARQPGRSGMMDVVWSYATAAAGAAGALVPATDAVPARQDLAAALALAWGLRLGTHIWWRGRGGHDDPRYAALRREWGANWDMRLFLFAQIQAACALVLALAIVLASHNPAPFGQWSDWAALALLVVAVAGEGIADAQLAAFRARAGNRGAICEAGLWSLSRHPNYFFEWLAWLTWPVMAMGPDGGARWSWLALAAPLLMYLLLVHASGIPPLEAHMRRSRGAAFADTQRRIRAFWPIPKFGKT